MSKVEERVCLKHKNEVKGNLILRYESSLAGCPLCAALENQGSPDERVATLNAHIEAMTEQKADVDSKNDELSAEVDGLSEQVSDLQDKIHKLENPSDVADDSVGDTPEEQYNNFLNMFILGSALATGPFFMYNENVTRTKTTAERGKVHPKFPMFLADMPECSPSKGVEVLTNRVRRYMSRGVQPSKWAFRFFLFLKVLLELI